MRANENLKSGQLRGAMGRFGASPPHRTRIDAAKFPTQTFRAMPHLSWNEVRDRAIRFSREHAGDRSESAEKQTFWNDFFNVFGLRRASLASFEENVRNLKGNKGAIDLLWKGRLLVEHKSFGEDLALAQTQAFTYIEDLTRENRWEEIPRFVLVSDFAHFVLYDLEPEEQRDLPLFDGRKIAPHHFTLSEFPKHIRAFAFTQICNNN